MSRPPRFSVVIPSYNREEFIGLTLDSVRAQTFQDFEVIVVDDGSTDRAVEIIRAHGVRPTLICQANRGAEAARTAGVKAARGEYLVLLDNDDLLLPRALETYERLTRSPGEPVVILGAVLRFHDRAALPETAADNTVEYLQYADYLSRDVSVSLTSSQLVVKRTVALATGAFQPEARAFPFDIPDMMLRLGTSGPFVIVLRPWTVAYRLHADNTIKRIDYMIDASGCLARLERQGSYPGAPARRFDRYACIGTMALYWVVKALRRRRLRTATRLLVVSAPMIAAGLAKRVLRSFQRPTPPSRLPGTA